MKTNVYVDGFNLYYGCLKDTPYRWLDLAALCRLLLPQHHINDIKYFTAKVKARPHNPAQPIRQQTYLRALQTLPNVKVIYGSFLTKVVTMPRASAAGTPAGKVQVIKTEEKGSDVNLAVHLVNDAHNGAFDAAVMITNDSDLVEPLRMVRGELGLPVGLINPQKNVSMTLKKHAQFIKQIRAGVLRASQFPAILTDSHGTFHKPASWK